MARNKKSTSKGKKTKRKRVTSKTISKKATERQNIVPSIQSKSSSKKTSYTKEELEHFKKIILEKKKEILEELEALRDTMVDSTTGEYITENSTYSTHMEQGTDSMEREKIYLFASREGKFLNYLEDALRRIEKGDYGRCLECGKLIDKERLEAVPHSQQCIECKQKRSK